MWEFDFKLYDAVDGIARAQSEVRGTGGMLVAPV
jgi:hypothetical protein